MQAMRPDPETTDEALVERALQGDDQAISALVRRYSGPLYSFVRRYHPDPDDCDDLFQETWIRALSNLYRFDTKKRFSTWLFQIALNQCRDLARRGRVRSRYQEMARGILMENRESSVAQQAEAGKVLHAIEEMPIMYKEVLLLRYYHQFTEAETSEILGCPRGTVKSRLHEAVKTLRRSLSPEKTGVE